MNTSGLKCDYIEDLENPRCEVKKEMASFWGMMGVDLDAGTTSEQILAACERCEEWSREDPMRLRHLASSIDSLKGKGTQLLHVLVLQG